MHDDEEFVCNTSKGEIDIVLKRGWSPKGAARFEELVDSNFFSKLPLFRCVQDFLCQFGYKNKHLAVAEEEWANIEDDLPNDTTPRKFKRGYISFAGNGKNSRSSHLFVTLGENVSSLGKEVWETPIGYVTEASMRNVVSKWETKYGDMPPWGQGPDAGRIIMDDEENTYLAQFPDLDFIHDCRRRNSNNNAVQVEFDLGPNLGKVTVELYREWAPLGVDRVVNMVQSAFLDQAKFFRVVPNFIVQFGMPADPQRAKDFPAIRDDPVRTSNVRGALTFAMAGKNTRSFQLFINLRDNAGLDGQGFAPLGKVIKGMEFVDAINNEYREQPDQEQISRYGNKYLDKNFPRLSYVSHAKLATAVQGEKDLGLNSPVFETGRQHSWFEFVFSMFMVAIVVCGFVLAVRKLFAPTTMTTKQRI